MSSTFQQRLAASTLVAALALGAGCGRHDLPAPSPPVPASTPPTPPSVPTVAPVAAATPPPAAGPVDPGVFDQSHCSAYLPPYDEHQFAGRARVHLQTQGAGAFHYQNLPARCGASNGRGMAFGGGRLRPGEGAEFFVCLPDGGRLAVRNSRHQVGPGLQPFDSTLDAVEAHVGPGGARLLRNMMTNQYRPLPPMLRSTVAFGADLRTASGTVFLSERFAGGPDGSLTIQVECPAGG